MTYNSGMRLMQSPVRNAEPLAPTANDLFDPKNWGGGDVGASIDAGRHFGSLGNAFLLGDFQSQLAQVGPAIANQNFARSALNELGTAQGRQKQVSRFRSQRERQAFEDARRQKAMYAAQGRDVGGAAELAQSNASARDVGEYQRDIESPENLERIYTMIQGANSVAQVMDIIGPMLGLDQQDYPRYALWLQQSAKKGGMGGLLNAIGQIAGLSIPGASQAIGAVNGLLGGSDAASDGGDLQQVRNY